MGSLKLYVAGGCEEHGRNCFLVQGEHCSVMFDCGVLTNGASVEYPLLDERLVKDVKWMFLSHSHADHSGAIGFLDSLGFSGTYAMTEMTLGQLEGRPGRCRIVDTVSPALTWQDLGDGIRMRWGWSGHCFGSVWYQIALDDTTVLFSGDYTEHSPLYACTPIVSMEADLAILDCAYGDDSRPFSEYVSLLLGTIDSYGGTGTPLVFPVPRHGRGLELMMFIQQRFPQMLIYADDVLLNQTRRLSAFIRNTVHPLAEAHSSCCVFVADPQLRKRISYFPQEIIEKGVFILTGTYEEGSYANELLKNGRAIFYRYPVHQNLYDVEVLAAKNHFGKVLLTHAPAGAFDEVLADELFCICPPGMGLVV